LLIVGKSGLIVAYNVLVPVKIILMVLISGYAAFFLSENTSANFSLSVNPGYNQRWLLASILYVAYKFTLAMVVLTEYQNLLNRRNSVIGAVLGGLMLGYW